jgi:anhydro-N-acetylmuramic acid kinase
MSFYRVLGLMSGTSLDGLDIAQCTFEKQGEKWKYTIERTTTYSYPNEWINKLANAENLSGLELMMLHNEFGNFMGNCVNLFLENIIAPIDFIASHGHTIFHQPQKGLTLQIGNGACLAAQTGITTICDFRTLDVAYGGQGAPLVPIGDKLLFGEYDYCLNLGGFANISYQDASEKRLAYDVCPVNIVLNQLVQERGLSFDPDGSIASQGNPDQSLLQELDNLNFYKKNGPKSLGKEWVLSEILPLISKYNLTLEDKLNTFCYHITHQFLNVINSKKEAKILVTGGGAHNKFLIGLFKASALAKLIIPSHEVIEYKEALIFALLGVLRFRNEVNCLSSVTGAKKDNIGGILFTSLKK